MFRSQPTTINPEVESESKKAQTKNDLTIWKPHHPLRQTPTRNVWMTKYFS